MLHREIDQLNERLKNTADEQEMVSGTREAKIRQSERGLI